MARDESKEIDTLRAALRPFLKAAQSAVVKDALSFGEHAPPLKLTRGFGVIEIPAEAFSALLKLKL